MLTPKLREYLAATEEERSEYTPQKRYHRRGKIRQRVTNGVLDMVLVQQRLEETEDQREKVFQELVANEEGRPDGYAALVAMTAFAFEGARRREIPMIQVARDAAEAAVEREIDDDKRAEASGELSVKITDRSERTLPVASAADKLESGVAVGDLDSDERAEVLRYIDEEELTTDEVTGSGLLEWWWERDNE